MPTSASDLQARIDAHNAHVAEHGRYATAAPPATKVKGAFPRKGKEPTLAEAIAAGTKVTLVPSFVADMVALLTTDDAEAWARASLLRERAAGRRGSLLDPRGDGYGSRGYMTEGPWLKAKAVQGRKLLRTVQGMTPGALCDLTDDPVDTRRMAVEMVAAVRRCQPEVAA